MRMLFLTICLLMGPFMGCSKLAFTQGHQALGEARKGDQAYDAGKPEKALDHYEKAEDLGMKDPKLRFNKGDALYQLEKYADAAKSFQDVAARSEKASFRAKAYHNLGNAHLKAGKLDKSIEAYKEALRLDPGDEETRYNLALARKLKKKSQEQKKKKQQKDKQNQKNQKQKKKDQQNKKDGKQNEQKQGKKDRKKKDGEKGKQNKNQKKQEGNKKENPSDQKDQEKKGQKKKAGQEGEKKKGEQKKKARLSPEEVKRLLKAMEANEAKVQRKLLRKKSQKEGKKKDVEKDW